MANEQYAFIENAKIPSRVSWQEAIDRCGFNFQLDPDLKPFKDSGFVPCTLHGREAGFEIYYDETSEYPPELKRFADGRDGCIVFRWGGSMIECASVMIACYALAKDFDAVITYEGEDPDDLENLLSGTNEVINLALKEK